MKHQIVGLIFLRNKPDHALWMSIALEEAQKAATLDEVPVGAVLVYQDQELARGHNQPIGLHDPSAHAEIVVLRKAAHQLENYRLPDTSLYVTLEPCLMCAGAIMNARISRVFFGASDPKTGCVGSVINVFDNQQLNHHCQVEGGFLEHDCAKVLQDFFKMKRSSKG
jgi:tRNA(adenine34) deaminase